MTSYTSSASPQQFKQLTPTGPSYTASQRNAAQIGGGARSYTASSTPQRSATLAPSRPQYTAAARGAPSTKSLRGLGQLTDDEWFVVNADDWAQIPGEGRNMVQGLTNAVELAKGRIFDERPCRVYRPSPGFLRPEQAILSVRRTKYGFDIVPGPGLGTDTAAVRSAVSQIVSGSARAVAMGAAALLVPPVVVGGIVRWRTRSWGSAVAAGVATAVVGGAVLGALRDRGVV
jgi:hypothetical protein